MSLKNIFLPQQFHKFYKEYKGKNFTILDVGCGNHSAQKAKKWFKNCKYYGIDNISYNNTVDDFKLMEGFYNIDLIKDLERMNEISNSFFDVVICSHIIEHLPNGLMVLNILSQKIKPTGKIYIEYPSVKSLSLPNMFGTLNFSDDSSHKRVYNIHEIANLLMENKFKIIKAGTRRIKLRIFSIPFVIAYHLIKNRRFVGTTFWDITGFAEYVYAEKINV